MELFQADNKIKIIGTRHREKLYETLLTKEEFVVAQDMVVSLECLRIRET